MALAPPALTRAPIAVAIGATEDAASGRSARPDGTTAFRETLLEIAEADRLEEAMRVRLHTPELVEEQKEAEPDEDRPSDEREPAIVVAHPAEEGHSADKEHGDQEKG